MDIRKLADGEAAPVNADCININPAEGGRFTLWGNALCGEDVVSLISSSLTFDDRDVAEEQGLAWAESQDVQTLYVTFDAPTPAD